jgi:hypothetical protein
MAETTAMEHPTVPCCPPLPPDDTCDVLDFHYRLTHNAVVAVGDNRQIIPVEVKIRFRLTRCPGPLVLGDLAYTTTLLPGEKVRLFTSDRRSRFTFDTSSKFGYRNTQTSEDSFYMQAMSDYLSDLSSRDTAKSSNQSHAHVDGHADAGVDILGMGGSANMSGNFDANSTSDFLAEHHQHAEAAHHSAEQGTRKVASVSVGETESRTHTQSESQDHYESASREFSNPNKCHALTFFFYQINKTQVIKYTLEAIERRVILDPANDFTKVTNNPVGVSNGVGVISTGVLATDAQRRETIASATASLAVAQPAAGLFFGPSVEPVSVAIRQQALQQVDKQLVAAGLLDKVGGVVAPDAQKRFSFEKHSSLPTPGLLVKGCLDDCDVCEPTLSREIELGLERKKLENDLLKRQIELLDKSQEYRCCPPGAPPEE